MPQRREYRAGTAWPATEYRTTNWSMTIDRSVDRDDPATQGWRSSMSRLARFRASSILALLAAFALLLAAAPAPGVRAQDDVTISYFTFSAAPDHLETLDEMVALFEAANPGIQVEVETAAFADYFTELQTRIAGGEAPDTFELNYENFVTYASKGTLLDLTTAVDAETAGRSYPEALQAFQLDGTQYGLPASFSNVVLFYN